MEILLANPRGFCAGVDRAIEIVNRALESLGSPIYVRHEVVHNKSVVDDLRRRGAIFVEDIDLVPDGATVIFSAHGVSQQIRRQTHERQLKVFDATCPLVTKVHLEVARCAKQNEECILIGHAGHPEVEGTLGQYDNPQGGIYLIETLDDIAHLKVKDPNRLAYVTQTTLSVDDTRLMVEALQQRFPHIQCPKKDDICYATQNRQDAVKTLAKQCDVVLVVGSITSSNSNRLCESVRHMGKPAYMIDYASEIQAQWLIDVQRVGVTASASAPEVLVQDVVRRLQGMGGTIVTELQGREEQITFALPKELRSPSGKDLL